MGIKSVSSDVDFASTIVAGLKKIRNQKNTTQSEVRRVYRAKNGIINQMLAAPSSHLRLWRSATNALQRHGYLAIGSTTSSRSMSSRGAPPNYTVVPKEEFGPYAEYSVIHTDRSLNLMSDPFGRVMRDLSDLMKHTYACLLYTSPSPRDRTRSRMPSSA